MSSALEDFRLRIPKHVLAAELLYCISTRYMDAQQHPTGT
ncbi:hypothetical protein RSAG8_13965, partial [Rhizoctonia solani AG-8 WAC10335]